MIFIKLIKCKIEKPQNIRRKYRATLVISSQNLKALEGNWIENKQANTTSTKTSLGWKT